MPGIVTPNRVNDGAWHHVVLTGDVDTQTLYLDGASVGSLAGEIFSHRTHTFVGTGWTKNQAWPQIGTRDWAYFEGSIAQVALHQRAITAADVTREYGARGSREGFINELRATGVHSLWGLEEADTAQHAEVNLTMGGATYNDVTLGADPVMRGAGAVEFNGSSSSLRLPYSQVRGRTRVAVEMWFQTTSTAGGVLYGTGFDLPGTTPTAGNMAVLYVGTDGKLRGNFWNGTYGAMSTEAEVNDGEWHHVVLSGDGETQWLYLDGNLVATASGLIRNIDRIEHIGAGYFSSTAYPARPSAEWSYFDGQIGEVAIYQRPLDSASVSAHYAARTTATSVVLTDPAEEDTTYTYDPTRGGRLVSTTAPNGGTKVFAYDTGGFVHRVTDENDNATTYVNAERGNQLSATSCRDSGVEACYTSYRSYFLNPDDPLDPRNDTVTHRRDARSTSATDDTYATRHILHGNGLVAEVLAPGATGGMQRSTTYRYTDGTEPAVGGGTQPAWLLKSVTDPAGGVTRYTYTATGDVAQVTDPAGLVTDTTYDDIGWVTEQTTISDATGSATTRYRYDGVGRLVEQLDPPVNNAVTGAAHQQRTTHVYNPDGTVGSTTVDDAVGSDDARTTSYTYDAHGRVHTVTDPAGGVTTTEYDAFGAVVRAIDPVGTEFSTTYTTAHHQLATRTVKGFTGDGQPARDMVLESRAYDPAGRLASVTDAVGRTTRYTYFDDNLLATEHLEAYTDPDSEQPRDLLLAGYLYNGAGQTTWEFTGDRRYSTETTYDPAGRAVTTTDRDDTTVLRSTSTTFDALDNPTRTIGRNADGTVHTDIEASYDPLGRETSQTVHTGSEALVARINRDQAGLVTSTVDPRGTATGADPAAYTTHYTYDALGQQAVVTAPPVAAETNGQPAETVSPVTTTGFNTFGETVDLRDPRGNLTHTTYDLAGRPTELRLPDYTPPGATDPIPAVAKTDYDPAGRVVSATDALGNTTTYGYDELGNQRRQTDPPALYGQAGGTWIATYTPLGEQLSVSDPNGAQTYATYDQLGRQVTGTVVETVPAPTRNLTTRYTYDDLGNLATVTSPSGRVTEATYDDLGNPLTTTDGLGNTTTSTYDGAGRPLTVTDPTARGTKTSYDQAGRLTAQADTDPSGAVQRTRAFGYDRAGNQTSVTDSLDVTTTSTYDALNQLTSITRPVTGTESIVTSYGYDRAGNITRATDGDGHATVFTANAWGLPESTVEPATDQTPNAADRTYTAIYDAAGRLASLRKPGGVAIANTYDPLGNITKQTGTGATAVTPDREFTYDPAGRLTGVSAPGGTNTYSYDDRGNLATASGPSGDTGSTWDDDGQQASATTSAGTAAYTYDLAGRLATATDPLSGVTAGYGYDDAGRLTSTGYGVGNANRTYTYDGLGRLATDTITAPDTTITASIAYDYDYEDRLISKSTTGIAGAGDNSYDYDQAGRLIAWDNGTTVHEYGWDPAGNLTRDGPDTATYNERNQLLSKADTTYAYTSRGTLASRTTDGTTTAVEFNAFDELVTDGTTTNTYDGLNRLIASGGTTLAYSGTGIDVVSDGTTAYTYTPDGTMLGAGQPGAGGVAWTDLHTDLIGLINPATGVPAGSRTYSPFGRVTDQTGTQPALGYQHQYTDPGSGNVNMGARWYNPTTGTFTSRDTAALDPRDLLNANRHAYGAGNPLTNTDPSGYCLPVCAPAIPGAIAVGARIAPHIGRAIGWAGRIFGSVFGRPTASPPKREHRPEALKSGFGRRCTATSARSTRPSACALAVVSADGDHQLDQPGPETPAVDPAAPRPVRLGAAVVAAVPTRGWMPQPRPSDSGVQLKKPGARCWKTGPTRHTYAHPRSAPSQTASPGS
ncbi:LamG-like jellyroll fold domain-containing protein [Saccharomonospora sp. NPDC046836]|uniref:LamG-like jellyroll fold domain-containing protein n=1 Tax=Saccharomonospora sp. NPDC046836 TaxID=3156921 RepID=UPI0033D43667